jgi:hypothetical protein
MRHAVFALAVCVWSETTVKPHFYIVNSLNSQHSDKTVVASGFPPAEKVGKGGTFSETV